MFTKREKEIFMVGTVVGSLVMVILMIFVLFLFHTISGPALVLVAVLDVLVILYSVYRFNKKAD